MGSINEKKNSGQKSPDTAHLSYFFSQSVLILSKYVYLGYFFSQTVLIISKYVSLGYDLFSWKIKVKISWHNPFQV